MRPVSFMRRVLPALLLLVGATSCDPQKSSWGFDAIRTMTTPADPATDPAMQCGQTIPSGSLSGPTGCGFQAGAHASDTLGVDKSVLASLPIRHVIVLMKENRSFDHLFGKLHDEGQSGTEGIPDSFSNPDLQGNPVLPFHASTTCLAADAGHQSVGMAAAVDGGKMDGFVRNAANTTQTDGKFVMSYYDQTDLPFYYWLAGTYALDDRHFAPMLTGTYGNRNFMMFGTNAGVVDTGIVYPPPNTPSIMTLLMNAGYTWGAYTDGGPFSDALNMSSTDPGVHSMQELYDALDNGTLPNVAFVDGKEYVEDDHPLADLQVGEAWLKKIYDHAVTSPQWQRLAIVWTYDEGGAFADHVAPPDGCQPSSDVQFTQRGPRVPLVVISPWAKRNYVSHVVHDHTAITRFIEALFDLPALSARDANSDALLDLFDFSCGRDLSVPAAPAPGTGGCAQLPPVGPGD